MTAAFMIHAAIHETLGDSARVVMHTHQEAATALTALQLNRVMDIGADTRGAESTVPYIGGALAMPALVALSRPLWGVGPPAAAAGGVRQTPQQCCLLPAPAPGWATALALFRILKAHLRCRQVVP